MRSLNMGFSCRVLKSAQGKATKTGRGDESTRLPPGVTLSGGDVGPGGNQTNLTFKAKPPAKIGLSGIAIIGMAQRDGQTVRHVAVLPSQPSEPARQAAWLSVNGPTPFTFFGRFESKFSPRGAVCVRHDRIDRQESAGPLEISLADRQNRLLQGVMGPKIMVPAHLAVVSLELVALSAVESNGRLKFRHWDGPFGPITLPLVLPAATIDERGFPVIAEALLELVPRAVAAR